MKMASTWSFALTLVLSIASLCVVSADDDDCFRVQAAFTYKGATYLVHDANFIKINSELEEVKADELDYEFTGAPANMDAAVVYSDDDYLYFFKGNEYYYYSWFSTSGPDPISSYFPSFLDDGIDAASTFNGYTIFMNGCDYYSLDDDTAHPLKDLGLPCDVDAAWASIEGDTLYVSKGNDVWAVNDSGVAVGPRKLSDLLKLTSAVLCTKEVDDPFAAKIKAEQEYELEHDCVIVDAAIEWEGTVYLFNNDTYMTLDDEGKEVGVKDIFEWGALPSDIDAGIVWSGNGRTYFFKGPDYYRYSYIKYFVNLAVGPLDNDLWGKFFVEGIDAAGNHNGSSYFFKDCQAARYDDGEFSDADILHNGDLSIPCDVDAAFHRSGALHVIKRNQVWTWNDGDDEATGPNDLSTVVEMTSWTACPP